MVGWGIGFRDEGCECEYGALNSVMRGVNVNTSVVIPD